MSTPMSTPVSTAVSLVVATPHGPFTAVVDADTADGADGAVLASGWTDDVDGLVALVHPALRPGSVTPDTGGARGVRDAVEAYADGDPCPAAGVPVRQRGGSFTEQVWELMRAVPAGAPVTYGELADRAGRPRAVRAVGVACARNAATLFVPCHRVLGSGGRVTGFRWGTELAATLLEHEAGIAEARDCRTPGASCAP